jgi:class 3 adenylate cyclase
MYITKWTQIFKLKNSFVLVFLWIQLLLILLTVIFYNQTVSLIEASEELANKVIIEGVYDKLDEVQKLSDAVLIATSKNTPLLNAISKSDRDLVRPIADNIWKDLKSLGFAQFQLFYKPEKSPDWKFFYRAQSPEKFDDSAENRPNVNKANATKSIVSGLSQGTTGYGFRSVIPLFLDSKQIGFLETGYELGDNLLNRFLKSHRGNWAIYNLARGSGSVDDRALIQSVGDSKETFFKNLMPEEYVIKSAKAGVPFTELDKSLNAKIIYIPVKNFQGDYTILLKFVGETEYFNAISEIKNNAILICLLGFFLSSGIIILLYRMITLPIKGLVIETEKIKNFELDGVIKIPAKLEELRGLVEAMDAMKIGLRSFRKYIPAELVQQLIRKGEEIDASGERQRLTIFFSDIADFSTISEKLTPNELSSQISEYLTEMTTIILKHGGTVDKYIGDSIMAFWGAPNKTLDHATQACLAAIECNARLKILAQEWSSQGRPAFRARIGLNTGDVVVGNIGSNQRLSYTAMGDPVNLASRLEGLNKEYATSIIISQSVLNELPDEFVYRLLDIVVVKGKTEPVPIYELVSRKGDVTGLDSEFLEMFGKAVNSYLEKDWDKALFRFEKLLGLRPDDQACKIFIERCREYRDNPPGHDWAGEYVFLHK